MDIPESVDAVIRMSKDIADAATTMTADEARFLVDAYYIMQDDRKRTHNQILAQDQAQEPHAVLQWLAVQSTTLENQIKRALDKYTSAHVMGSWMRQIHGIGPVLSAGLLAHIDIKRAPTVGHIWRFAGLDPTCKWEKGQRRPWNAKLKVLTWKCGQSFMKFSNDDRCYYGKVYRQRKDFEIARNESGRMAETAAQILTERKIGKDTEAYKAYIVGKLPPGQIDARARRYAVKLFLAHMHEVWWVKDNGGGPAPKPYPIEFLGPVHTHWIRPPV